MVFKESTHGDVRVLNITQTNSIDLDDLTASDNLVVDNLEAANLNVGPTTITSNLVATNLVLTEPHDEFATGLYAVDNKLIFNGTVLNEFDTRVLTESSIADSDVQFLRRSNLTVNATGQLIAPYDPTVTTVDAGVVYGGVPNRVYSTGENNLGLPKLTTSSQVTLRDTPVSVKHYGVYTLILYGSGLGFDILVNTVVELSVTSGTAVDGVINSGTALVVLDGVLQVYKLVFGLWVVIQTIGAVNTVATYGPWMVLDSGLYKFSYQWYKVRDFGGNPSNVMIYGERILLFESGDVRVVDPLGNILFQRSGVVTYDLYEDLLVLGYGTSNRVHRYEYGTYIFKYEVGVGLPSIAGNEHVWVGGDLYHKGIQVKSVTVDGNHRGARTWVGNVLSL